MGAHAHVHLGTLDHFASPASLHALLVITSTVVPAAVVSVCVSVCVCVCVHVSGVGVHRCLMRVVTLQVSGCDLIWHFCRQSEAIDRIPFLVGVDELRCGEGLRWLSEF